MRRSYVTIWVLVFTLLTLQFSAVKAAESDTHFRGSYIKLRLYGISHEYALFLSKNNQGTDEMLWSSAFLFSNQRLMHHFHGDNSHMEPVDPSLKDRLPIILKTHFALAERNHALGNFMIWMGLKYGNAKFLGMGLHHLTDTYFHAGFAAALGHAANDHSPDDTSKDPAKYQSYIYGFGEAAKAIRTAVDGWGHDYATAIRILSPIAKKYRNYENDLTPEDFQNTSLISDLISKFEDFQSLYYKDVQTDPSYKREAYKKIYTHLVQSGVIEAGVEFENFFPQELIADRNTTVEQGVKIAIRDQIGLFISGQQTYIRITPTGEKPSKFGRYLKSNFDRSKFAVEIERIEGKFLSFVNQQNAAVEAMYSIDGTVDSVQEERAANAVTAFEVNEAELMSFFDPQMKAKMLTALGLLDQISKLNGGATPDFLSKISSSIQSVKLPEGVSPSEVQSAGALISEYAKFLASNQKAAQLATGIVKDFVPVKFSGWVKSQFALDGEMRAGEVIFKDELARRFIAHHFGENFVNEKRNLVSDVWSLAKRFTISTINAAAQSTVESRIAEGANKYAHALGWADSKREAAYRVNFSVETRMKWPMMLAPVTLATFPLGMGNIVIDLIKAAAYEHAKEYQGMSPAEIEEAIRSGKFKRVSQQEIRGGMTVRPAVCRRPSAH